MPTPRKRRIARLVILLAGLGLVLFGVRWWVHRQQHDPRVVGWWRVTIDTTTWPLPIWEVRSDGTATVWYPTDRQNRAYEENAIRWRSNGDQLIWWNHHDSFWFNMKLSYARWLSRARGNRAQDEEVFPIVELSDRELVCEPSAGNGEKQRWLFERTEPIKESQIAR